MVVKKKLLLPDLNEQFLIYSSGCQSLISWNLWFYLLQILHANNAGISYYHIKHCEPPINQIKPAATVKQGRETHAIARIHYLGYYKQPLKQSTQDSDHLRQPNTGQQPAQTTHIGQRLAQTAQ